MNLPLAQTEYGRTPASNSAFNPKKDAFEAMVNNYFANKDLDFARSFFDGYQSEDFTKFYFEKKKIGFMIRYSFPDEFNQYYKSGAFSKHFPKTFY